MTTMEAYDIGAGSEESIENQRYDMPRNGNICCTMNEPDYKDIEIFLKGGKYPENIKGHCGKKANFRRMARKYIVVQDRLHFRYSENLKGKSKSQAPHYLQVIKDNETRITLIKAYHEGAGQSIEAKALGGHVGRDNLRQKLLTKFWWPCLNMQVREYVKTSLVCQKGNTRFDKAAIHLHPIPVPSKVWEQIGVDLCSLPKTSDGFIGIAVAIDYFSKWIEAVPLRKKDADEVAKFLYSLICRHGCPLIQINDQGREFCNKVCSLLHELTGTNQRITSAYHPQSNGLVERGNRTLQGSLLKVLEDQANEWPRALEGVLFAFRIAKHSSTGYTPFQMLYGRHPCMPIEVHIENERDFIGNETEMNNEAEKININGTEFIKQLDFIQSAQASIHVEAAKNIKKAQAKQKSNYELRHKLKTDFKVGKKVLLYNLRRASRKGGRHVQPWDGPYKVKSVFEKGTYLLETLEGKELKTKQHGTNLKTFHERFPDTPEAGNEIQKTCISDSNTGCSAEFHKKENNNCAVASHGINVAFSQFFLPTTPSWRSKKCGILKLPVPSPNTERRVKGPLGQALKLNLMVGDGNCLFRAVSYEVTLSEIHHGFFRSAACSILRSPKYRTLFESKHLPQSTPSADEYLENSKMEELGTWGTDIEIIALATLLKTSIVVYSCAPFASNYRWLYYHPEISPHDDKSEISDCHIYLKNPGNHFDRIKTVSKS